MSTQPYGISPAIPKTFQFRPNDNPALRSKEETAAYAEAQQLKSEIVQAQDGVSEVYVQNFEDMKNLPMLPPGRETLARSSRGADGELTSFIKNEHTQGSQFKISNQVVAGMMGGIMGAAMQPENMEVYTRMTMEPDGSSRMLTVTEDRTTGVMNYSEFLMAGFPGTPT